MAKTVDIIISEVAAATNKSTEEVAAVADSSFVDDLGMTSLEIFPLISKLEDEFDIEIDFADFLSKAGSVNAAVAFVDSLREPEVEAAAPAAVAAAAPAAEAAAPAVEAANDGKKVYCGEPYEDPRCAENCHCVTLSNGVNMPYVEFGEENDEVIVTTAPYFITFNSFLKDLAEQYHVYGFIIRSAGDLDQTAEVFDEDGDVFWTRQWGLDLYDATQKLGLTKFAYLGKCIGVQAGYGLVVNHPELLTAFVSISQTMHAVPEDADEWNRLQKEEGASFSLRLCRHKEGLVLKAKEAQAVKITPGRQAGTKDNYYGSHAELHCDSLEEVQELLENTTIPFLYMFPTEDILYQDFHSANIWAAEHTRGARTVILQGEKHLFEVDIPKKMAWEVKRFMEWKELPDA